MTGYSTLAGGAEKRAFLYSDGTMYDLNDLVSSNSGTGWVLIEGRGINERGQIAGNGNLQWPNTCLRVDAAYASSAARTSASRRQ